jgi:uncharacterized protein (DUF3820 family)
MRDIFEKIYQENGWNSGESRSGRGSTMRATKKLRAMLPDILETYEIRTLLDLPCGDFNWFRKIKLPEGVCYLGADIVPALVVKNQERYATADHRIEFTVLDITTDRLPGADMIICRDLFGHLSNYEVKLALANIRSSGIKYLLATTYPDRENSGDIETGQWRPLNLDRMWGLPRAELHFVDNSPDDGPDYQDKMLGLWEL